MTAKELKERLDCYPDDMEVFYETTERDEWNKRPVEYTEALLYNDQEGSYLLLS